MVLRTARRGRNAGGQFWGCPHYPGCRGIRPIAEEVASEPPLTVGGAVPQGQQDAIESTASIPITWVESVSRPDFVAEYVSIAALPGTLQGHVTDNSILARALGQCLFLSRRSRPRQGRDYQRLVSSLLLKIVQRGRTPLPTIEVEREALHSCGLLGSMRDLSDEGVEIGWDFRSGHHLPIDSKAVLAGLTQRSTFVLDDSLSNTPGSDNALLGSNAEAWFIEHWVPGVLGATAGHWFTPQAPLDTLIEAGGGVGTGSRRIDFLFSHPGGPPLAIEVDGPEHTSSMRVDRERDRELRAAGIEVLRVSNDEVTAGHGATLDQIRRHYEKAMSDHESTSGDESVVGLLVNCATAAKVQFAMAKAIGYGWLTPGLEWEIQLAGCSSAAAAGVLDSLNLLTSFDRLYGGLSVPTLCTVRAEGELTVSWAQAVDGQWCEVADCEAAGDVIRIAVDPASSPFHRIPDDEQSDFLIRPAYLPVDFASESTFDLGRRAIAPKVYEDAHGALTTFLRHIFRKQGFRANQGEAVFNVLRQNDSVVLLPTGAGKSIIYQLAGLLMPGITLVVDPLVSLIEDQVDGLRAYGIDRAAPLAGSLATPVQRRQLLLRVERGEYQFVLLAPERLQSPQFRGTLRALVESSLVNLVVIDEAHCVSDWGHDFRPAYLNLANNLRRLGADSENRPPPILALSGTASRAVLRDMFASFEIDRNNPESLIRPESFDRTELTFDIVRTSPAEDPQATLRGVMNSLPARFSMPRGEFFTPAGRDTASGIVFVPTVNARRYGLTDTRSAVRDATSSEVVIYSGSPPRGTGRVSYETQKRQNALEFKRNHVPLLVATKAFGMGIDKPNIRYTVHFGLPMSLENFYQEAGRAGRDRRPALCVIVFSELSSQRSDSLLDPDIDTETVRNRFNSVNSDRRSGDDVTRALWFHLEGFRGVQQEFDNVRKILSEIGDLATSRLVELPLGSERERTAREKAVYRLLRLGVISDYQLDYGARRFVLHVDSFDVDHCKRQTLDYVLAAQPAKGKLVARQLDTITSSEPHQAVLILARILTEFSYDVIERSRRRMIQEAVLLARQARDDDDIRDRLLDYLQEGLGAESIDQLLTQPEIDLAAWRDLSSKIQTPMDAGELRGLCIRALESYPDHPGLLLIRGIAEAMCSSYDESVVSQEISSSLRRAVVDYDLPQTDVEAIIDDLFDLALTRAHGLGFPLVAAILALEGEGPDLEFAFASGLARAHEMDDSRVQAILATRRMHQLVVQLDTVVDGWVRRYESPAVSKALFGATRDRND